MRTALLGVTVVLSGCFSVPLPSNDPDSGVSCTKSTTPTGSASLQGTWAFAAGSAYQWSEQTIPPDSGVTGATLTVQVLRDAVPCTQRLDAGTGDQLVAMVVSPGVDRVGTGHYVIAAEADGGAWFYGYATTGGTVRPIADGTVSLTTISGCSAAGSFDVHLRETDGGVSPLTGSFNADYCLGF